jgi:hypothetical protein
MVKTAPRRTRSPRPNADAVIAAMNRWRARQKRFYDACKNSLLSDEAVQLACNSASSAFDVFYETVLRAAGCDDNEACTVVLPDGTHIVTVHDPADWVSDRCVKVQIIPPSKVVKLS